MIAIIGAGIFVKSQYLPRLAEISDLVSLKCIWSRSQKSAQEAVEVAKNVFPSVKCKYGDDGLDEIVNDTSIVAALGGQIQVSMVEIYGEEAYDMLMEHESLERVPVRCWSCPESKLRWWPVESEEGYGKVLKLAKEKRIVSATHKNAESSRSHLIITFKIIGSNRPQKNLQPNKKEFVTLTYTGKKVTGTLNMIDLAGGEKPSECSSVENKEATDINMSLMQLRNVIQSLCKKEAPNYRGLGSRGSRLTMILKTYLNSPKSKIFMITNISPEESSRC